MISLIPGCRWWGSRWLVLCGMVAAVLASACYREGPPEVRKFVAPKRQVVEEKPKVETVVATAPAAEEAPPAPVVQAPKPPQPETKPAVVEKPVEAPPPEAPPTLVGTWRASMSHKSSPEAMPPGMEVTMTFGEDGSISMTMTMPGAPEQPPRSGSYTVSDGSITITMENDTKTGTLTFEGNNRAIIEVEEVRLELSRH